MTSIKATAVMVLIRMREPASFLMMLMAIGFGYACSDFDSIASQISGDSMLSHLVVETSRNYQVLASSCVAFAVSVLLGAFAGASEIPRDISTGLIQILLSKPLSKLNYMLGKYFGVLLTTLCYYSVMLLTILLVRGLSSGNWLGFALLLRQFELGLAFVPIVAIVISFSCFVGDIAAIILSMLYLLFSMLFNFVPILIAMLPRGFAGETENAIFFLYYLFPNFIFYFIDHKNGGVVFLALCLYSAAIAVIFLAVAAGRLYHMDFSKRN